MSLVATILALLLQQPSGVRPCSSGQCEPLASELAQAVEGAAAYHRVRESLLLAVAWRESRFDPHAVSESGDWGVWQLNPESYWYRVARGICEARADACLDAQAHAAAALLRVELNRCRSWRGSLTAYHWGHCKRDGGYARRVLRAERRLFRAGSRKGGTSACRRAGRSGGACTQSGSSGE